MKRKLSSDLAHETLKNYPLDWSNCSMLLCFEHQKLLHKIPNTDCFYCATHDDLDNHLYTCCIMHGDKLQINNQIIRVMVLGRQLDRVKWKHF